MNLKRILNVPLTAFFLFLSASVCLVGFSNNNSVVIDAGHGGEDSGAVSDGYIEKEWNLDTARACANELVENGVYVYETRTDDVFVSLEDRAYLANSNNVDYFISIHHNSSNSGEADRGEIIYSIRDGKSKQLALSIEEELKSIGQTNVKTYTRTNGVGTDYYSVLRNTRVSAIIIEVCFIDNPEDRQIADTKEERERNGIAIAHGILKEMGIPISNTSVVNEVESSGTNIMNKPSISYNQLYTWAVNNNASQTYLDNLQYVWDKSLECGVDPALVATQIALETDYMRSYIFKTHNNTAGMKATTWTYKKFDTIHDGIDAQIEHLMIYAGAIKTDSWLNGWCITVEGLAGRWAEDPQYSDKLLSMMNAIKNTTVDNDEEIKTNNDKTEEVPQIQLPRPIQESNSRKDFRELLESIIKENSSKDNAIYNILNRHKKENEENIQKIKDLLKLK